MYQRAVVGRGGNNENGGSQQQQQQLPITTTTTSNSKGTRRTKRPSSRTSSKGGAVTTTAGLVVTCIIIVAGILLILMIWIMMTTVQLGGSDSSADGSSSSAQQMMMKNNDNIRGLVQQQQLKKKKRLQQTNKDSASSCTDSNKLMTTMNRAYDDWRQVAVELASRPVDDVLDVLETKDPFGVRKFEVQLTQEEERLGRILTLQEIQSLFPCPRSCSNPSKVQNRITVPDKRLPSRSIAYKRGDEGTFLFFQHLRKAGGTHFCSLAETNLPKSALPKYYCMPDYKWSNYKNAGYLHHWSNEEITSRMLESGHRVAGNEWDTFDPSNHFKLQGAVFATSFRRPLDRALSQFRFECIEDRGCHIKNVTRWWDHRKDLYNVYTITFADPSNKHYYGKLMRTYTTSTTAAAEERGELIGKALDTVSQFDLVLVMEWLAYAGAQVSDVLGFNDTSVLTKRVRPHIKQYKRNDNQDTNELGAASITKASWDPKKYLDAAQYQKMSRHLALDSILTDAARRMFLERLVC